ncbi:flagellar hook protein FlgE [Grimontia hollisae]|uniref:Flagellar hook protein FlgE n=1 Tax=Grimontia hollisae CIP 101886 TaxID=675812 RepID=D0I440_GRIHO|nr:flagellar hook protein FlgE [Grimontia hollisae]AMG30485.1 flagellar hook protein FlgE [Grimontia hollisae]EEY73818.1 flagellar hook protein FlgE [Grimontia hollisae CIP 101886]MDF2183788.1 flagellar hook protein FlgE [Grimontia hollisae]STO41916.1 Flagellar hook protein flgE [Grimontia hollisae]STQ77837.1 Flagellar hook protein flgE [Grimontia hollisae]
MSINIGLSGLRATSDQINTISHNISNVGTVGYKSSRTEFQDVYAPQFGGGEFGGVEVSNVRQSFTSGAATSTGRNSDLAINGEGFFMVQQNGQRMYTRNGIFNLDSDGYLVTADGLRLQGYGVSETGSIQNGALTDLQISTADMAAKVTTKVSLGVNLDASAAVIVPKEKKFDKDDPSTFTCSASTTVYDSLGGEHEITQYFVKTDENTWSVHYVADGKELDPKNTQLEFDENGKLIKPEDPISVTLTPKNGSATMKIEMDVSEFTQFGSDFSINESKQDGYAPGKLAGWYFDADGSVYARYSNGKTQLQGQLVLARFPNQEGLQQAGGTRWTESFSSGTALFGQPGTGQFGALRVGAYESSNVDLTEEMVSLMSAQSNYQANAKTIQASQEMVQILFQNM